MKTELVLTSGWQVVTEKKAHCGREILIIMRHKCNRLFVRIIKECILILIVHTSKQRILQRNWQLFNRNMRQALSLSVSPSLSCSRCLEFSLCAARVFVGLSAVFPLPSCVCSSFSLCLALILCTSVSLSFHLSIFLWVDTGSPSVLIV